MDGIEDQMRRGIEPVLGWLFVVIVVVALGATILVATQPRVEVTGRIPILQSR
jgi:hypothetical protein